MRKVGWAAVLGAVSLALVVTPTGPAAADPLTVPSRVSALQAGQRAIDHFYANNGGATADAGWRWAPFFMAVDELHRQTGEARYGQWLTSWGDRNAWTGDAPASATSNPDSRAAIQVFHDVAARGLPADMAPSDRLMAQDLALPAETYWWIDAMFMGLPLWPRWAARTGDPAYAAKHTELYEFLKYRGATRYRSGCTDTGLFDPTENLWWRDCKFVPVRDAQGRKEFWGRGNGWVLGAMARTLMVMPASDPQAAEYRTMMQRMAARLVPLQGPDGMWRSDLLNPSRYPAPETSATALFTYAMAYGIRSGVLDAPTYLPVVLRAWQGLTTVSLTGSGFLSNCQLVGDQPGAPSTTTSIGYCVGAFGLAATAVAALEPWYVADGFARTTTGGLGEAPVGGAWSTGGGSADFSVDGTTAHVRTAAGHTRTALLDVSTQDVDMRVTYGAPRPTSGKVYLGLVGRQVGTATYTGRAVVDSAGSVQAQVHRSGTSLRSVTVAGLTLTTGERLRLRLQAVGTSPTTVRLKVWKAGTTEPTAWQASVTDGTEGLQTAGTVGFMTYLGGSASPSPVVVTVDDLSVRRS